MFIAQSPHMYAFYSFGHKPANLPACFWFMGANHANLTSSYGWLGGI